MKRLSLCLLLSVLLAGCELESIPQFSSNCPNFSYILIPDEDGNLIKCERDHVGVHLGEQGAENDFCSAYDDQFLASHLCPEGFRFCIESSEIGNGCAKSCPIGTHIVHLDNTGFGLHCVADDVTQCGHRNCTTDIPGWKTGSCENGKCVLENCKEETHFRLESSNICLTRNQSCGVFQENCTKVNKICAGDTCQDGCGEGLVLCDNEFCIDPKTSSSYCGADSSCSHYEVCSATERCETTSSGSHCVCDEGYTSCNDTCVDVQTSLTQCGSCTNDCSAQPGWVAGSCMGGVCTATQCAVGFHPDDHGCAPDTDETCGSESTNCTLLSSQGWNSVACQEGTCVAQSCNSPLVLSNGQCGNVCGGEPCTAANVGRSTEVKCEQNKCVAVHCISGYDTNGAICCPQPDEGWIVQNGGTGCTYACDSGFSPTGKVCCKIIPGTSIRFVAFGDSCTYECTDSNQTFNGARCCANVAHGTIIADSSEDCHFTCEGNYFPQDGNCVNQVCDAGERRCINDPYTGAGILQFCQNNAWVNDTSEICNGSCTVSGECGDCLNGGTACVQHALNRPGQVMTCENGVWGGVVTCTQTVPQNAYPECSNGACNTFTCASGYTSTCVPNTCINYSSNKDHCGSCGHKCSISHASQQNCWNGHCVVSSCVSGYHVEGNECVQDSSVQECDPGYHMVKQCERNTSCEEGNYAFFDVELIKGKPSEIMAYCIRDERAFLEFKKAVNMGNQYPKDNKDNNYVLAKDILIEETWDDPIGLYKVPFTGVFLGNGHSIRIPSATMGIFGEINGATIADLNYNIQLNQNSRSELGGLANIANKSIISKVNGDIRIVRLDEKIELDDTVGVGGLLGNAIGSFIHDCSVQGSIRRDGEPTGNGTGGLVGLDVHSEYLDNLFVGVIKSTGNGIGGLAGITVDASTFEGCVAKANINEDLDLDTSMLMNRGGLVGGFIGKIEINKSEKFTIIKSSAALGTVRGTDFVGGFIGSIAEKGSAFENIFTANTVQGHIKNSRIGGFAGFSLSNVTISNSYFYSDMGKNGYAFSAAQGEQFKFTTPVYYYPKAPNVIEGKYSESDLVPLKIVDGCVLSDSLPQYTDPLQCQDIPCIDISGAPTVLPIPSELEKVMRAVGSCKPKL